MTAPLADFSPETIAQDRARLLDMLRTRSFQRRRVILSSGKESDFYIDVRKVALSAEGHWLIGRLFLERLPPGVAGVGGMTLGADPLASATSFASYAAGRPIEAFLVRKESKKHGTEQFLEQSDLLPAGASVVVVEDVVTTGASTILAIERVRQAGLVPVLALAVVDRQEGGREAIEATGVPVESLFLRTDFIPEGT